MAPAVSNAAVVVVTASSSLVHATVSSSNCTRPTAERLSGAYGTACFCPLSAMAANHGACFGARSHARIAGLLALFPSHTSEPWTSTV